uniref:HNH endonuclease n=1 Tax=Marseillevirus LCMAC101 TaxID=2506602 RepID=A0A481YSE5_9VIRU|nr:MAG: HNH endonuclease [Marseillevirus LCMAC101]
MADDWKNFPVINGKSFSKYEVSSMGQIRNKKSGYVFSNHPDSSGYVYNNFHDDEGNTKRTSVHNIVARVFLGEPETIDLTVDHINRDRADNRLVNLRWATTKQQAVNSNRSKCRAIGQPVIQYTMEMKEIKTWPNITAAAKELGIDNSGIGEVCKGKRNYAGGFKWTYERQDLEGEVWRDYEPMGIRVSNMGRIKPPHCHIVYGSKTGDYLTYGKSQKYVHVIIAEVFLPNLKKKPEVNHKDKDGTNNKLENLEWSTRRENIIHSHQTNSNPDRYSTAKAIKQYDLEGNLIGEYRSIGQASRQTECSASTISRMCLGNSENLKEYVFKYTNEDVLNRLATKCPNKVDLIDENGNVIETYESVRMAAFDLEISHISIYKNLCGNTKKTRDGHCFRYH